MTDTENPPSELASDEVRLFDPPIPDRVRPEHISEVIGINALDLESLGDSLTMPEFEAIGKWVQITAAGSPWWEGDWGNYGELMFGDDYYQAIEIDWSDSTEHARRRVTAGAFPRAMRRTELSFDHHQIVVSKIRKGADIDQERQSWLDMAIRDRLTGPQLAKAIREAQAIEVEEVGEIGSGEPKPDPVPFTTFTMSFTVPVQDAETAEPVMERAETALRAELERAGCLVQSVSNKRKG